MKNGLATWHYPHRDILENVVYFAECGFESVSLHGAHMSYVCEHEDLSERLAELIKKYNIILTVHHKMPVDHSAETVSAFKKTIDLFAAWQEKYKALSILSFDVPEKIRDNIRPYVDYVLLKVSASKIALEDFGLNDKEKSQIEHLKGNERFGYLVDVGHMYIRICGKVKEGLTLFCNSPDECAVNEKPTFEDFLKAFKSKNFPVFEVHLHNNDGKEDLHYFLENGTLDLKIIADVLKNILFEGVVTIESAPGYKFKCEKSDADQGINKTYTYWKSFLEI